MTKEEIWKSVSVNTKYMVSNLGNIMSMVNVKKHKILKKANHTGGYDFVTLSYNGSTVQYYVHRLVAEAFIENDYLKPEVNHINGNKKDNRAENLEWVTRGENLTHKYRVLKIPNNKGMLGRKDGLCKMSIPVVQLSPDGFIIKVHHSRIGASRDTGINRINICKSIKSGKICGGSLWV